MNKPHLLTLLIAGLVAVFGSAAAGADSDSDSDENCFAGSYLVVENTGEQRIWSLTEEGQFLGVASSSHRHGNTDIHDLYRCHSVSRMRVPRFRLWRRQCSNWLWTSLRTSREGRWDPWLMGCPPSVDG